MTRFVVTGSGRCGTKYLAALLTASGVPCTHEGVFNADGVDWPDGVQADSSWMAVPHLPLPVPVVLLVRHPLAAVRSWVEIGFFGRHDADNPTHGPLRAWAPQVYDEPAPADRALSMWLHLNRAAAPYAEMTLRLEHLDAGQLARLLRWAGADDTRAGEVFAATPAINRHEEMRRLTGVRHVPTWAAHRPGLVRPARDLARLLGYDPDEVPGG